uniref:Uncharacterized protein n=1 Tax=viral metagenome TaxID=1070528 RepID=A0A6M3Y0D1_9ZZZZ
MDLNELKSEIQKAKELESKATGRLEALTEQLDQMGLKTLEKAEEEVTKIEKKLAHLDKMEEEKMGELRKNYDWE